jgi:hypothetical protein
MEARLTGRVATPTATSTNNGVGGVNPRELTPETYEHYCRLYLIERIYEVIPGTSTTSYGNVAKLINCIDPILFENLNLETNKLLLLNKIYSLFMSASNEEISREFLYKQVSHIASYDPALYE